MTEKVNALAGLDVEGLEALRGKVKAKPEAARRTLKATTVCQGAMVNHSFVRDLGAFVIDEPPNLLGTDEGCVTARYRPPSEVLARHGNDEPTVFGPELDPVFEGVIGAPPCQKASP